MGPTRVTFISIVARTARILRSFKHEECANETHGRKKYFQTLDLEGVRMRFRILSGMVNTVKSNFKQSFKNKSLTCESCKHLMVGEREEDKPIDSQLHLIESCKAFEDLRTQSDLNSDAGIVSFFKEVIHRRIVNSED